MDVQAGNDAVGEGRGTITCPLPRGAANGLLATLIGSGSHNRRDLRENRADAGSDTRHDGAGCNGYETSHQSVLDEVLTARVLPNSQLQNQIFHFAFAISSPVRDRSLSL
jgi:hypothetical protein